MKLIRTLICLVVFFVLINFVDSAEELSESEEHDSPNSQFSFETTNDFRKMSEINPLLGLSYRLTEKGGVMSDSDKVSGVLIKPESETFKWKPTQPMLIYFLTNKQKEKAEKSSRIMTPRLGRGINLDTNFQRSRPPFAPRLGKKSFPFKPRLGRRSCYNEIC